MSTRVSSTARLKTNASREADRGPVFGEAVTTLTERVRAEYVEMPGLHLTALQAARLFGMTLSVARAVLDDLRRGSVLTCSDRGTYSLSR
jgi:hypothetical protein